MNEDTPKIVSLETSLELAEFPSEAEFSSEAAFPAEVPPTVQVAPVPEVAARVPAAPVVDIPVAASPVVVPPVEPSAPVSKAPLIQPPASTVTPMPVLARTEAAITRESETDSPPHLGPAVVAEFPVKPQTPAAVAVTALPAGPVSLVELIERRGGFDWREAVAVIQQICVYLRDHSPQTPILLDPRTIQITERGEVRLLSGQTSSDPLVIQVGRLLRTMLMGKDVPPELRLLLSQATFELPIFESIEDVDRALAQLNKLDEPGPAGLALLRAVAAPPPPPNPEQNYDHRPPPIRSILPASKVGGRRNRGRSGQSLFGGYGTHVAVIFAGIALIAILLVTRPSLLFPQDSVGTPVAQASLGVPSVASTSTSGSSTPEAAPLSGSGTPRPEGSGSAPSAVRRQNPSVTPSAQSRATNGGAPSRVPDAPRPDAGGAESRPPAATVAIAPPPPPTASPRESERRARELFEGGKPVEASVAFDDLVRSNPLYEPRRTDLTPEALAAFRRSQQTILPEKVRGNADRGRTALAGGDYDAAIRFAREALAIIDRHPEAASAEQRDRLEDLLDEGRLTAATATEVIHNEGDPGITPPRQLTRQMPLTGPQGIPSNRVGWLDMVIGKDGTVVNVRLTTPLNRYHERMIVSAAKAWMFRPATKSGKPVLCRIRLKINLPESGTDDY